MMIGFPMKSRIEIEAGVNGCLLISDNFTSDLTSLTKHTIGFLEQQLAKLARPSPRCAFRRAAGLHRGAGHRHLGVRGIKGIYLS